MELSDQNTVTGKIAVANRAALNGTIFQAGSNESLNVDI
jgi:hypothetical protein